MCFIALLDMVTTLLIRFNEFITYYRWFMFMKVKIFKSTKLPQVSQIRHSTIPPVSVETARASAKQHTRSRRSTPVVEHASG